MSMQNSNRFDTDDVVHPTMDAGLALLWRTRAELLGQAAPDEAIRDSIGGWNLELETPAPLHGDFVARLLARIDAYDADVAASQQAARAAGRSIQELLELPMALRELALDAAGRAGWVTLGRGFKAMRLATGGAFATKLLRIEPGCGAPHHDHTGLEYTLVIKGAFDDGQGLFQVGDVATKSPGQIHHPIAQGPDVCLALSVEEGTPAFLGPLGLFQRILWRH